MSAAATDTPTPAGPSPAQTSARARRRHARGGLPPGPPIGLLGGTLGTWTQTLAFWQACRRMYGPLFTLRVYPWGRAVLIADSDLVKEVFTGDPQVYFAGQGNSLLTPIVGERSLLVSDGEDHLRARKRVLPPFRGETVKRHAGRVEQIARREAERWPIGRPFALHPRMNAVTFAVALRAIVGIEGSPRAGALHRLLPRCAEWNGAILAGFLLPALKHVGIWRSHQQAVEQTRAILSEEIRERRRQADLEQRDDVLSLLVAGEDLDDLAIRDEVMTLLLGGEGTTAATLSWTFDMLLHRPAILERAREGGDDYLDAVIHETLRVRPVIPTVARQLQAPVELGGYTLPAGVAVLPCIALLHSDPLLYPQPGRYLPERFLEAEQSLTYTWIPFGGGRRRCPGATLASLEARIALRTILECVTLRAAGRSGERARHRNITMIPARGMRVIRTA